MLTRLVSCNAVWCGAYVPAKVLCVILYRWKVWCLVLRYSIHIAVVVSGASWENIVVGSSLRV